jgi:CheY-like chemotaxis protein
MKPQRIVVVDNEEDIRSAVAAIAHEAMPSASVSELSSGLSALHEVEAGADLLITNCHMPDMDGPTLVKTIREQDNLIPIIMVSSSEDARDLGSVAGINRFVPKLEIYSALTQVIQSLLAA